MTIIQLIKHPSTDLKYATLFVVGIGNIRYLKDCDPHNFGEPITNRYKTRYTFKLELRK